MMHILESIGFYESIIIILAFSAFVIIADEIMHARAASAGKARGAKPGTESVLIQVEHLTKCYGPVRALDDVSFAVGRGEVAALLGPNGSGKSTLMRCLIGFFSPTAGSVRVGGVDVAERPVEARREVGYLPEQVTLYPELRVRRYLRFVAGMKGLDARAARRAVDQAIARCGLESVADRLNGTLSKGYRQRVGLAQALLGDPPVLVLDEPTVGLDPVQTVEMRELLAAPRGLHRAAVDAHPGGSGGAVLAYRHHVRGTGGGRGHAGGSRLAPRGGRARPGAGGRSAAARSRRRWRRCPACSASTPSRRRSSPAPDSSSGRGAASRCRERWRRSWSDAGGRCSRCARSTPTLEDLFVRAVQ